MSGDVQPRKRKDKKKKKGKYVVITTFLDAWAVSFYFWSNTFVALNEYQINFLYPR